MPRSRTSVWFFLLLVVLASAAIVIPYVYNVRHLLQPDDVETAARRWHEQGPVDYTLVWREQFHEKGAEPAVALYGIEVREGKLIELRLAGKAIDLTRLTAERQESFTVPGLMKRIASEVDVDVNSGKRRNYLTAYFDPKTGCPLRYVRRNREEKLRLEWTVKLIPIETQ